MINWKELKYSSNLLSVFRLLLAVPFWILLDNFEDQTVRYITFALCLFAAFTDMLDGYVARKFNQVTEMGKVIDPLADKVAVGIIIVKLYLIGEIPAYYFFLIIGRDLLIFTGGLIVSKMLNRVLPSNILGKITVINIGIVILLIIIQVDRSGILFSALYLSSIGLIIASLVAYAVRAIEFIKQSKNGTV